MTEIYGRDLDLNLLRVFVVVASAGSVTQAAAQLYLTQPAVSAAMRRLTTAVGAPLFARSGRGLVLTERGGRLLEAVRPQLAALVEATLSPPRFDAKSSARTLRIGLSDAMEGWLLPRLLRTLRKRAPHMRLIALPVTFRSVAEALASRAVDLAITVTDELPPAVRRQRLFQGGFVCLFDPRHVNIRRRLSERDYFAHEHIVVSYNGDLRGVVEDELQKQRNVRCSVSSFSHVGAVISGSALLATVPDIVAEHVRTLHPRLRTVPVPFTFGGSAVELLWTLASDDDPACAFVREQVSAITAVRSKTRGLAFEAR